MLFIILTYSEIKLKNTYVYIFKNTVIWTVFWKIYTSFSDIPYNKHPDDG